MSYKLTFFVHDKNLFSFKKVKYVEGSTIFENPCVLTQFNVNSVFYKNSEVAQESSGVLYPGFLIEYVYLKNGVLHFIPEESPVNVVFTYKL